MDKFRHSYFWNLASILILLGLAFQVNAAVNSGFDPKPVVPNAKLYPYYMMFIEEGKWKTITNTKINHRQDQIYYDCEGYSRSSFGHGCDGYGVCPEQDANDNWNWPNWHLHGVDGIIVGFRSKYSYKVSDLKARLWNGSSWSSSVSITSLFGKDGYHYYEVTDMSYNDSDLTDEPLVRIEYQRPTGERFRYASDKSEIGGGSFAFCTGFH